MGVRDTGIRPGIKEEINRKQREKYAAAKETAQAKKERIKQQKRESKQCVKQRKQLEA
jgi:hypothetical protein